MTVAVGPATSASPTQEVTAFGRISCRFHFADGDTLSFTTMAHSPEADELDELASDVWLFGPVTQRYRVINIGQSWDPDGDSTIEVQAVSYKKLLGTRHVGPGGLNYVQIDQGDIVWDFIAHTQAKVNGDWGITKGPSTTGVKRDRTYVEGDNLGTLAENLQNVIDGLWWDVDVDRRYSAAMPDSFVTMATPIQLGTNARHLQRKSAADRFANVAYGDASDETVPVWVEASDLSTDPRGRWENAYGWPTVTEQATLQQHTQGALTDAVSPLTAWSVEMEPQRWLIDSLYLPGDFVVVVRPPIIGELGAIDVADRVVAQVMELGADFDADGAVAVTLALNETRRVVPA